MSDTKIVIPQISDERLADLVAHFTPLYNRPQDGDDIWVIEYPEAAKLRTTSYIWAPVKVRQIEEFTVTHTIKTIHGGAFLFKPDIAELLAHVTDEPGVNWGNAFLMRQDTVRHIGEDTDYQVTVDFGTFK